MEKEWDTFLLFVLVAVLASLVTGEADAAERCQRESILFGGWSKHMVTSDRQDGDKWNETHNVIGYQCNAWSVVHFTNSYDNEAWGVGYEWTWRARENWRLGLYGAVWSGYAEYMPVGEYMPVVSPTFTYTVGQLEFHTLINPIVMVGFFGWRF